MKPHKQTSRAEAEWDQIKTAALAAIEPDERPELHPPTPNMSETE